MSLSKTVAPPLPRSTPEEEGIPSSAILGFIEALEQHAHPLDAVQSFMLLRHGTVVVEGWWAPYRPDVPHMLYSLSKSFTSSAIGIAVAEGLLSIDDPVLNFFPDDAPADPGEHLRAMTVKHLLTMNTGHHEDTVSRVWDGSDANWPRAFLSLPVEHEPGTWFVYNTPATYMLSAIITQLTGEFLIDYLQPRLFEPLGIEHLVWDADAQGRSIGGSGLHITTDSIARFGQMYLQKGEWNGQRLLTEAWIDDATAAHSDNSITQTNPDWTAGYGYQFWRNRPEGYRGDGAFGQYCIVLPEQDVVLAMTSGVRDMQRVLDCVWQHLLPAFSTGALPDDPTARTALEQKLASLSLPITEGAATSNIASAISGTTYAIAPNGLGIERVRIDFDDDYATLVVTDTKGEHRIVAGYGAWRMGASDGRILEPGRPWAGGHGAQQLGASGAWTAEDTYELRICYIEGEVCPILRFSFSDADIRIDLDPNVSWDETAVTTLIGHVEP